MRGIGPMRIVRAARPPACSSIDSIACSIKLGLRNTTTVEVLKQLPVILEAKSVNEGS